MRHFRQYVSGLASEIPAGIGTEERKKRLEDKKNEILHEWEQHRKVLPRFAKEALAETSVEEVVKKIADHLPELVPAIAAGTITAQVLGAAPGITLTIVAGAGLKMWRRKDSPLKFLNRIDSALEQACENRAASLYLPQWSKLPGV